MRILGIDPGLHITGWGIIDYDGFHLKQIGNGTIITNTSDEITLRLSNIFQRLSSIIEKYVPEEVGIEDIFVNKNPISSLKLGMARGAAMCCVGISRLKIAEYTPNKIKKSVVGAGHATKEQISIMVQKLLNCGNVKLDAADALAIAICHAHYRKPYETGK
ncbi:MAG: crossover junction endodeoxyribonuclease RuvC [Holosporaceae bacterium]|jgi:crossover junction endodeoxyribonuclease RuvC|nr:crossover junction endodeoxyribonuclease RuvC [Holosporaceae bacterium]